MICMLLKQNNFAQQANLGCLETRLKFFIEFLETQDFSLKDETTEMSVSLYSKHKISFILGIFIFQEFQVVFTVNLVWVILMQYIV